MRRSFVYVVLSLASLMVASVCVADGRPEQAESSTKAGAKASPEVCTAADALEMSLDALEDSESSEEYKTRYEVVRQNLQKLRKASDGKYDAELNAFDKELTEFGKSLTSLDDGGLISGLLGLAEETAELAVAGDRLDDAIDCPGSKQAEGSTKAAASAKTDGNAPQTVCAAADTLEISLDALEDSESSEEYKTRYDVVRQDFQKLRKASGGKYDVELNAFEKEMTEFGKSLTSLDDGGLISGLLGLAEEAAELAAAGDHLDDAIDCPES